MVVVEQLAVTVTSPFNAELRGYLLISASFAQVIGASTLTAAAQLQSLGQFFGSRTVGNELWLYPVA